MSRRINCESIVLKLRLGPRGWLFPEIHITFLGQQPEVRTIQPRRGMEGHLCLAAIMAHLKISGETLVCDAQDTKLVGAITKVDKTVNGRDPEMGTSWAVRALRGIKIIDVSDAVGSAEPVTIPPTQSTHRDLHPIKVILELFAMRTVKWADNFDPQILHFHVNNQPATDDQLRAFIRSTLDFGPEAGTSRTINIETLGTELALNGGKASEDESHVKLLRTVSALTAHLTERQQSATGYRIAVEALIFDGTGKLLLQKRGTECRDEIGNFECIGGQVFGDDLIDSLDQQVRKRVGEDVRIEVEGLLDVHPTRFVEAHGPEYWVVVFYLCRLVAGKPRPADTGKTAALRWVDLTELNDIPDEQLSRSTSHARDVYFLRFRTHPYYSRAGSLAEIEVSASDYVGNLRFSHGNGAYCWTTDGRKYIDLICGQGPVVLGHAHPMVTAAVLRQLEKGTMLPGPGPAFDQLREVLVGLYPHSDDLLTFKTGSEAVAAAIRLARAHTGRDRVIRVGFHGWHDQVISPYVRCHSYDPATFDESLPLGVPHGAYTDLVHVWHGSEPADLLSLIRATGQRLAAVIIDPVQLAPPSAAVTAHDLARVVSEVGALLIFDESKTGFRVHLGGVQALFQVAADLTVLGKAMANGLPLAVVLGKRDLITLALRARIKGTFGAETASIAAALATVETLKAEDAPRVLNETGEQLIQGLNQAITSVGLHENISAVPYHWACMPYIHFRGSAQSLEDAFYVGLLHRGVLMLRDHMSYVSLALTPADVNSIVLAAHDTLEEFVRGA